MRIIRYTLASLCMFMLVQTPNSFKADTTKGSLRNNNNFSAEIILDQEMKTYNEVTLVFPEQNRKEQDFIQGEVQQITKDIEEEINTCPKEVEMKLTETLTIIESEQALATPINSFIVEADLLDGEQRNRISVITKGEAKTIASTIAMCDKVPSHIEWANPISEMNVINKSDYVYNMDDNEESNMNGSFSNVFDIIRKVFVTHRG